MFSHSTSLIYLIIYCSKCVSVLTSVIRNGGYPVFLVSMKCFQAQLSLWPLTFFGSSVSAFSLTSVHCNNTHTHTHTHTHTQKLYSLCLSLICSLWAAFKSTKLTSYVCVLLRKKAIHSSHCVTDETVSNWLVTSPSLLLLILHVAHRQVNQSNVSLFHFEYLESQS